MKQFTAEEIQATYETLPQHIKDAISSDDVRASIESIGKKFGLHIDQLGDLVDEVGLVMLGLKKPKNFTSEISSLLKIDSETAGQIATDLNTSVFSALKQSMRETSEQNETVETEQSTVSSSLEKLGGFSIEKNEGNVSDENSAVNNEAKSDVGESDRESILSGIEDPAPSIATHVQKVNVMEPEEAHVDPLIDHLLTTSVSTPEQKIEAVAPTEPKKITEVQKPKGNDPYREPIK